MAATAAQRLLESDLRRADFLIGVDAGKWSLAEPVTEAAWPVVYTNVHASLRANSPEQFLVRWDLGGYNSQSPTGAFWDAGRRDFLAPGLWPKGRAGSPVAAVFKTEGWAAPGKGFYHPFDRQALAGHHQWAEQNPHYIWTSDRTLTDFLHLVHRWLNCEDFLGC